MSTGSFTEGQELQGTLGGKREEDVAERQQKAEAAEAAEANAPQQQQQQQPSWLATKSEGGGSSIGADVSKKARADHLRRKEEAALQEAEAAKTPEDRAAEVMQAAWRRRQ